MATFSSENKKRKRHRERIIVSNVTENILNSQIYLDLLAAERKLDNLISRKRLELYDWMSRPHRVIKRLRVSLVTNQTTTRAVISENSICKQSAIYKNDSSNPVNFWEFRIEGKLVDESSNNQSISYCSDSNQTSQLNSSTDYFRCVKKRFSDFFQSVYVELDGVELDLVDCNLLEWHKNLQTQETDGFYLKRPFVDGKEVQLNITMRLNHDPPQFKLDSQLSRLLGVHTQTRARIINAMWIYIKNNKLIDCKNRQTINCDKYLKQIFSCETIELDHLCKLMDQFLYPPDPITIHYTILPFNATFSSTTGLHSESTENWSIIGNSSRPLFFEIDIETDDPIKIHISNFLNSNQFLKTNASHLNSTTDADSQNLDTKINSLIDQIKKSIERRLFYLKFSNDPVQFIHKFIMNQNDDLSTMLNSSGLYAIKKGTNLHEGSTQTHRTQYNSTNSQSNCLNNQKDHAEIIDLTKSENFYEPWVSEAVHRYIFQQIQMNRIQIENAINNKASYSVSLRDTWSTWSCKIIPLWLFLDHNRH